MKQEQDEIEKSEQEELEFELSWVYTLHWTWEWAPTPLTSHVSSQEVFDSALQSCHRLLFISSPIFSYFLLMSSRTRDKSMALPHSINQLCSFLTGILFTLFWAAVSRDFQVTFWVNTLPTPVLSSNLLRCFFFLVGYKDRNNSHPLVVVLMRTILDNLLDNLLQQLLARDFTPHFMCQDFKTRQHEKMNLPNILTQHVWLTRFDIWLQRLDDFGFCFPWLVCLLALQSLIS